MAQEQTEQDYELGDPSGQATGFDDEDSEDLEDLTGGGEEPFTDMDQFERFETSEDLLTALTGRWKLAYKKVGECREGGPLTARFLLWNTCNFFSAVVKHEQNVCRIKGLDL